MTKTKDCGCGDASCGPKCKPKKYKNIFNVDFMFVAITTTVTYSFYMVLTVALLA